MSKAWHVIITLFAFNVYVVSILWGILVNPYLVLPGIAACVGLLLVQLRDHAAT